MLSKRIFWTLLIAAMLVISTTVTQAQSTGRKLWPRGYAGNNPVPVAPEQATERAGRGTGTSTSGSASPRARRLPGCSGRHLRTAEDG